MFRNAPVVAAGLALAACAGPQAESRGPGAFEYGRVDYDDAPATAHHPASLSSETIEAVLADLEYRSAEYEDRGSAELFPQEVLVATAAALAGALSRAGPDEVVVVDMGWDVGVDPAVRFVNHLTAEFHVADGALHMAVRRFDQTAGGSSGEGTAHPLLAVSSHGTLRPGLSDRISIPLHR